MLALAASACGGDDGGSSPADAAPDAAVNLTPIDVMFEGETFTLGSGVATMLGDTVLDLGAQAEFGVVLSDQPLLCTIDFAARPAPGMYAVLWADRFEQGVIPNANVTLLLQTSGPRMSVTGNNGGTTEITAVSPQNVAGNADHDFTPGNDASIAGTFDVPLCP